MGKVRVEVFRARHPPPVAKHYFKLANRLRRWLGIKISLMVADHDQIDACLGQAILDYILAETECRSRELHKGLRACIACELVLKKTLAFRGAKHDSERVLDEELLSLISAKLPVGFFRSYSGNPLQIELVRSACADVISDLQTQIAKAGRKANEWYDPFVFGMWLVAVRTGIGLSTQDRVGARLRTPFLDLVGAYEMCLPKQMRSSSRVARAKRIQVSLKRLRNKGLIHDH